MNERQTILYAFVCSEICHRRPCVVDQGNSETFPIPCFTVADVDDAWDSVLRPLWVSYI